MICSSNHDQVGNRAFGDRLPPAARRVAAACVLFAPQVPLLFQGEEYGEQAPFQFFTDHDDPAIAEATREGRRAEFATLRGVRGARSVPDPQARGTFERSKLHPESGDDELRAFYGALIDARCTGCRARSQTEVDEAARVLRVRRGDLELDCRLRQHDR